MPTPRKISVNQAKALASLLEGNCVPQSDLTNTQVQQLLQYQVIDRKRSGGGFVLSAPNPSGLSKSINLHWGIPDIAAYAEYAASKERSRSGNMTISGNSKAFGTSVFSGIYLRLPDKPAKLGDQPLARTQSGTCHFIHKSHLTALTLPSRASVAIVENAEPFLRFEELQEKLSIPSPSVVIFRYGFRRNYKDWLSRNAETIFYVGDYDPAGLKIFATEILPMNAHASFPYPVNIESLIRSGKSELYLQQKNERAYIASNMHASIETLWNLINGHRKGYEQEGLLNSIHTDKRTANL